MSYSKFRKKDFVEFVAESGLKIDTDLAWSDILEYTKYVRQPKLNTVKPTNKVKVLEDMWYASLEKDNPNYEVYADPYYICDLWVCWVEYSRTHIRAMTIDSDARKVLDNKNVKDYIGKVDTIVDLGCGYGFTSAFLRDEFDCKRVVGTNLVNTWQFNSAKKYGETAGFEMVDDITKVKSKIDVVFASEYFEHISDPMNELQKVIDTDAKFVITRNGFNGRAIGHFHEFLVDDETVYCKKMNRVFKKKMEENGYKLLKKSDGSNLFHNNAPMVWKKV